MSAPYSVNHSLGSSPQKTSSSPCNWHVYFACAFCLLVSLPFSFFLSDNPSSSSLPPNIVVKNFTPSWPFRTTLSFYWSFSTSLFLCVSMWVYPMEPQGVNSAGTSEVILSKSLNKVNTLLAQIISQTRQYFVFCFFCTILQGSE